MKTTADMIGRSAIVRAADTFYAYIDGKEGEIVASETGCYWIAVSDTDGIYKTFLVPPDQLEVIQ